MRTIQMTLDDDLVKSVDKIVKELKTTRSAFARAALREAISKFNTKRLEDKHRKTLRNQNTLLVSHIGDLDHKVLCELPYFDNEILLLDLGLQ